MGQVNNDNFRVNIKFAKLVIGFIWVTYFIYLVLPWELDKTGVVEYYTIIFLSLVSISFYLGCKSIPVYKLEVQKFENRLFISNVVTTFSLLFFILVTLLYISDMISQRMGSLSLSIGENYMTYQQAEARYNSLAGQLYVLSSPFRYFFISYCIVDYKLLNKGNRFFYFVFLAVTFLHSLIQGKNVGLGYIVTIICVSYLLVCIKENNTKLFKKRALVGLSVFVIYFIIATSLRTEAYGGNIGSSVTNTNNIFIRVFGLRWGTGILRLLNYFSHGYKGLNYCLQLPFEWTYGYGGAMGFESYLVQYFNVDSQLMNTYPGRMETVYDYSGLQSWPTVFPWWASDFSFPGVVVLMFFVGRFSCVLIKESLVFSNKFSAVLLSYFSILLVCLPLNNQLFQTRPNFISSVVLFALWLFHFRNQR